LKLAMELATTMHFPGQKDEIDSFAQGVYVAGQYPPFSAVLYASGLAEATGQDSNRVIAGLESLAANASSLGERVSTFVWAFTLRGMTDERFRYPVSRIWAALQTSAEYRDGTMPEYVKEWMAYAY
jgi:hypothetical protein